jgi:tetratricopeptide (TPR) repeat protein
MRHLIWLGALLLGSATSAGVTAFEDGRADEAATQFSRAVLESEPSAALLMNLALAELHAGHPEAAEASAERAALAGGPAWYGERDFLLGAAAWQRSMRLETRADLPGAGPDPFQAAIAAAELARESWKRACMSRADWPEARRNLERAILRVRALKKRQEDRENAPTSQRVVQVTAPPPPPPPTTGPAPVATPPSDPGRLDEAAIAALRARLQAAALEKRRVRMATRATSATEDW